MVSRFALNLPALTERPVPRPDSAAWQVRREVLPLGSVQQPVLHASRALLVPGLGPGAIDLYVSEDYWNLPFLTPRDPYSLLYRPASLPSQRRGPPVDLFVFDARGQPAFYSTERPPMGLRTLEPKSRAASSGFWTSLDLDGQPFDAFVFGDGTLTNVLGYPRRAPLQRVADLLDAAASALCVTALAIALLLAVRTLLRRRSFSLATLVERIRGRFAWRLLVAFVLLAVVPVGVLQVVATRVVRARLERATENQALQRAYVSQKAVEDYAVLQGEDGAPSGVSDDALIYVASLLRSDLALFQGGRLRAASKRELYTSGLLSPQVDAQAFRQVVLEGQPLRIQRRRHRRLHLPRRLAAGRTRAVRDRRLVPAHDVSGRRRHGRRGPQPQHPAGIAPVPRGRRCSRLLHGVAHLGTGLGADQRGAADRRGRPRHARQRWHQR